MAGGLRAMLPQSVIMVAPSVEVVQVVGEPQQQRLIMPDLSLLVGY